MVTTTLNHGPVVPLNLLSRQHADATPWVELMKQFLAESRFVHGSQHQRFEKEFATYCDVGSSLGVGNGTDAIEVALRSAGVQINDEVITVANAGFYASSACLCIGAIPVYADIDPATLTMCPQSAARCVTPKTKALVVTHLYGKMANIEELRDLSQRHGLALIEDCAQAHGAEKRGAKAGSWGLAGTFSFYPTKNLGALGDGGAITTSDAAFAERVRLVRQYGWTDKYLCGAVGRNSRLDELQAAFLCAKLPQLDERNRRRREIVRRYHEAACGSLEIVHADSGADYVAHLAIARHPARDEFRARLCREGVDTGIHYPVLDHQQPCLVNREWRSDCLANTEEALTKIFTLPCFPELTGLEVDQVCAALTSVGREIG